MRDLIEKYRVIFKIFFSRRYEKKYRVKVLDFQFKWCLRKHYLNFEELKNYISEHKRSFVYLEITKGKVFLVFMSLSEYERRILEVDPKILLDFEGGENLKSELGVD